MDQLHIVTLRHPTLTSRVQYTAVVYPSESRVVEVEYDTPKHLGRRLRADSAARWLNARPAPSLDVFTAEVTAQGWELEAVVTQHLSPVQRACISIGEPVWDPTWQADDVPDLPRVLRAAAGRGGPEGAEACLAPTLTVVLAPDGSVRACHDLPGAVRVVVVHEDPGEGGRPEGPSLVLHDSVELADPDAVDDVLSRVPDDAARDELSGPSR